jgi:hypothetical protein
MKSQYKEHIKMTIRIINKEDKDKHSNESQENSRKEQNERKKIMQDTKEEFNKETEILKKYNGC